MKDDLAATIKTICKKHGKDRTRLMDVVREVQVKYNHVGSQAMELIAKELGTQRVEVEGMVTFYAFLSKQPKGKMVIRLCNCALAEMWDNERVAQAFEKELGIKFGETTPDGEISLEYTACIGMCDQSPAAMCNEVVLTNLSTDAVKEIVATLKQTGDPKKLVKKLGDGQNANALVKAMVNNNIRKKGPVIFAPMEPGAALKNALAMTPAEVIRDIKTARLRGRGGAGFPTGLKWDFTRGAEGRERYVVCNADEGEPGTFKDRVILTECADLLFEGMTIAGYAVGAKLGLVYLRGEYEYLRAYLEDVLSKRRKQKLLGRDITGAQGFNFDIRIQMGAGAYVCGEETALLSSAEGLRGEPKNRPPFPAQKGYLGEPTVLNNVETYCCAARILEKGAPWFAQLGSKGSPGTKLVSVSGDCQTPGVYEVPFGQKISDLLAEVGAKDAIAVQVGGPSGQCLGPECFDKTLCYDDVATGGSFMIFGPQRNILDVATYFMHFFIEESCGHCTPCRVGNTLIKNGLDKIRSGKGEPEDLAYLQELGETVKAASRCGLGQTSPNPVLTTIKNFRSLYEARLKKSPDGLQPTFDLDKALAVAERVQGRKSVHFEE